MADDRNDPVLYEGRHDDGSRGRRSGGQKGAQQHAQGGHGPVSRAHLLDQLQSGAGSDDASRAQRDPTSHDDAGKHRLFEGREQHDEADQNSERNRLERDIQDHGHDRGDRDGLGTASPDRAS